MISRSLQWTPLSKLPVQFKGTLQHVTPLHPSYSMDASTSAAGVAGSSGPVKHNALPPPSTQSAARASRIATHSHIKGLGLTAEGLAATDTAGFVGQTNAREVSDKKLSSIFGC